MKETLLVNSPEVQSLEPLRVDGGSRQPDRFPPTHWSLVVAAGSSNLTHATEALGRLCDIYRQPVFRWLKAAGLTHHAAEDAAQDLMEHLLGKQRLGEMTTHGARFRTYLLTVLRHRMLDRRNAQQAAKRGGGAEHIEMTEIDLPAPDSAWDRELDREFAVTTHRRALAAVEEVWRNSGRHPRFLALEAFVLRSPAGGEYAKAGADLGLHSRQVKRLVFDLREDYFDAFRAEVVQAVEPEELAGEIAYLVSIITDAQ